MLKIHGIEDHLVPQMETFKGIGCFIEQAHQSGMKDEKRTANMRDRKCTAYAHSSWEQASQHPDVMNQMKKVSNRSKRNLKNSKQKEKIWIKRQKKLKSETVALIMLT